MGETGDRKESGRLAWVDVAKGIGILCIVAGHIGPDVVRRAVYPFHVPLFFILAGFFISTSRPFKDFMRGKARALLLPFLWTVVVMCVLQIPLAFMAHNPSSALNAIWGVVIRAMYGSGTIANKTIGAEGSIGAIWFLEALFWGFAIVYVCVRFFGVLKSTVLVSVMAVCAVWSARYVWLPVNIQSGMLAAGYVFIGWLAFKRTTLFEHVNWVLFVSGVVCLLTSIATGQRFSLASNSCNAFSFLSSILISYVVIVAAKFLSTTRIRNFFLFFGVNSLWVLCIHQIEHKCFPWWDLLQRIQGWGDFKFVVLYGLKFAIIVVCVFALGRIKKRRVPCK